MILALIVLCWAAAAPLAAEEEQPPRPVLESWRETLRFGIDSEVASTLKAVEESRERSLDREIGDLLTGTAGRDLKVAVLEYFIRVKHSGEEETVLGLLGQTEDSRLSIACIRYLAEVGSAAAVPVIAELLRSPDDSRVRAAIQALGRIGGPEESVLLLEYLKDPDFSSSLKPEIILAIGQLGSDSALGELIRIVESTDEPSIWRMYSADALGRIGDERAIPALERLFEEGDALLRIYAASALANFSMDRVMDLLMQGLRDNNVRVRIASAKGLANPKAGRAVEILKYKAAQDPEWQVRVEALQALGAIGTGGALRFLEEVLLDEKQSPRLRQAALDTLVREHLDPSLESIGRLLDREWETKRPVMLEYTARRLSELAAPDPAGGPQAGGTIDGRLEDMFVRMLDSGNYLLRIYGIRGLAFARVQAHRGRIEALSRDDPHPAVRRAAEIMLGRM